MQINLNQVKSFLISLFSKSDGKGGRGVKNLKKLMTSFMNGPTAEKLNEFISPVLQQCIVEV